MCSRFGLNARPRDIALRFGLEAAPSLPNTDEMRPTDLGLVISADGPALLRWGFEASWTKKPLINARSETLQEKSTFRPHLDTRCLVPASAYFEWRKEGRRPLKNEITLAEGGLFAMAGLIAGDAFTIVTCPPAPEIAHIHDRMPVILEPSSEALWRSNEATFDEVQALLRPYPADLGFTEEDNAVQGDFFA